MTDSNALSSIPPSEKEQKTKYQKSFTIFYLSVWCTNYKKAAEKIALLINLSWRINTLCSNFFF